MGATAVVQRRRHVLLEIVEPRDDDDGAGVVAPQVTAFVCDEGREILEVVDLRILRSSRGEHHVHMPITLGRAWEETMGGAGVVDPPRASEPSYARAISDMLWRLRDAFDEVL